MSTSIRTRKIRTRGNFKKFQLLGLFKPALARVTIPTKPEPSRSSVVGSGTDPSGPVVEKLPL